MNIFIQPQHRSCGHKFRPRPILVKFQHHHQQQQSIIIVPVETTTNTQTNTQSFSCLFFPPPPSRTYSSITQSNRSSD